MDRRRREPPAAPRHVPGSLLFDNNFEWSFAWIGALNEGFFRPKDLVEITPKNGGTVGNPMVYINPGFYGLGKFQLMEY